MIRLYYISIFIFLTLGCKEKSPNEPAVKNSPLIGKAEIWCDESLQNIISQQEDVFESAYPHADITVHYAPELVIKRKFYTDSIDVMIVSQAIDTTDLKLFKKRKVYPRQYVFGKSALAFIGSSSRKNTKYTYQEMLNLLEGKKGSQLFAIENNQSGISLELMKHLKTSTLSKNIYALKSKNEVIEWVKKNPNGIGIIDWGNISDEDDPDAKSVLSSISLIKIGRSSTPTDSMFYDPYQHNLNGLYPFTRDLHYIRRIGITNVSLGFASFICEERGQKIMLKAGLLPQYQSERWVEFKGLTDIEVVKD